MARTFINQSSQVGNSENYLDNLATGSNLEFTGSNMTIQDDLNALRTMVQVIKGDGKWYDGPVVTLSGINTNLDAEESRALSAEASLADSISTEVSTLTSDLDAEESRALSAEASLDTALSSEASRATSAETSLASYIDAEISSEESRALSAEASLGSYISTESSTLTSDLSAEESRAMSAEASLDTALSNEVSRAESAELILSGAIETEKGRINAILSASNADYDTFKEIVDLINSVDTENDTAFAAYVLSNDAALSTEVSTARSAESSLTTRLSSEESRATSAESSLTTRLSSEESRATSAEASLDTALSSEASRATSAEASLGTALTAEESRAMSAEASLGTALTAEESRAMSAEASLESYIDAEDAAEESRAMSVEASLDSAVSAEASRAASAEASLATVISDGLALKLDLAGGTMSGAIDMGGNLITNVALPTTGTDAANKDYVDSQLAEQDSRVAKWWGVSTGGSLANVYLDGTFWGAVYPTELQTMTAADFRDNVDVFFNGQLLEAASVLHDASSADVALGTNDGNAYSAGVNVMALYFAFPITVGDKVCLVVYT